ncbi:MAG: Type 1 glutamine amidotransferase-like domain-containing protein [bacterium]|nr:Type 1 glutamine amidotransferase-like domain-containing protein [bacterium]
MTKYILIGGYSSKAKDGGKAFCEELVKGFTEPVKILICLFARPKDTWQDKFKEDNDFFTRHLANKKLEIVLAKADNFIEQVSWADAIYLRGGETERLAQALKESTDWTQQLTGKTLAGTSAGADIISKYYYDLDNPKIRQGLGILPIKVIVHYKSDYNSPNIDWTKAFQQLKDYKEDLPLVTLREGEFKVIQR